MSCALEVRGLSKSYPKFALEDVGFRVEAGTVMGFIGRNGAGKTTTLKCLLNLVHPDAGSIEFFGMPWAANEAQVKRRIGFAAGGVDWYPRRSLGELAQRTATFYPNWDDAVWSSCVELFALDEGKRVRELSEGMKVKANVALALSHHAELLLLDEPTSGLDPVSRDELLEVFSGLAKRGVAILFSTHITSDLDKCADVVTYIKGGRIVASCEKAEFTRRHGGGTLEDAMLLIERGSRQ